MRHFWAIIMILGVSFTTFIVQKTRSEWITEGSVVFSLNSTKWKEAQRSTNNRGPRVSHVDGLAVNFIPLHDTHVLVASIKCEWTSLRWIHVSFQTSVISQEAAGICRFWLFIGNNSIVFVKRLDSAISFANVNLFITLYSILHFDREWICTLSCEGNGKLVRSFWNWN